MTEAEALYEFFNSFGMDAYPTGSVPDDTVFPWMVYESKYNLPFTDPVAIAVNIYFHTESEELPNKKVKEIYERIGRGGVHIPYSDGIIWMKCGSPFSISLVDSNDSTIKQRQLNIYLEYL